jgi:hypothetical protein
VKIGILENIVNFLVEITKLRKKFYTTDHVLKEKNCQSQILDPQPKYHSELKSTQKKTLRVKLKEIITTKLPCKNLVLSQKKADGVVAQGVGPEFKPQYIKKKKRKKKRKKQT